MSKSKIIVIEGTDGSGKATQTELLASHLKQAGLNILTTSFPKYDSDSSALVKMYLNGQISDNANDVSAKAASLFYAADRYITYKKEIEEKYKSGKYVMIFDRYSGSNIIHQGAKLVSNMSDVKEAENELKSFISWLDNFEHNDLDIPRPDAVIYLNVPVEYTEKLRQGRKNKSNGKDKQDVHEADSTHLRNASKAGLMAADMLKWHVVECVKNGQMRTVEDIQEEVYNITKNII